MAYDALGSDYVSMGQTGAGQLNTTPRHSSCGSMPASSEKLAITADYYETVTGELDKAAQIFRGGESTAIHESAGAYGNLGSNPRRIGTIRESVGRAPPKYSRLTRTSQIEYANLAMMPIALQRFDEAQADAFSRRRHGSSTILEFHGASLCACISCGRLIGHGANSSNGLHAHPKIENFGLALASDTEAYAGHLRRARELTKRAVESAIRADSKETGAIW